MKKYGSISASLADDFAFYLCTEKGFKSLPLQNDSQVFRLQRNGLFYVGWGGYSTVDMTRDLNAFKGPYMNEISKFYNQMKIQ